MSHRRFCFALPWLLLAAACSGSPTRESFSSTVASTSSIPPAPTGIHYVGTIEQPAPLPPLPLDLSLFFRLPGAAVVDPAALKPAAIFEVTGGYNTGPNGFTGSIEGTLDG